MSLDVNDLSFNQKETYKEIMYLYTLSYKKVQGFSVQSQ